MRLLRKKEVIMVVSVDSTVNALDSFVSWGFAYMPSHSCYMSV
jgi:hypothetical protein